jgi:hypothetical protein
MSPSGAVLGTSAELAVLADLLARGYRVYWLVCHSQHPDIVALDAQDRAVTVEVRAEQDNRGSVRRVKKASDRTGHYAWVDRETLAIQYEPPLSGSPAIVPTEITT